MEIFFRMSAWSWALLPWWCVSFSCLGDEDDDEDYEYDGDYDGDDNV